MNTTSYGALTRRALLAAAGSTAAALPLRVARAAEPPLKIGVLTDMSGPNSDLAGPGSVLAATMAAEDARDILGGRTIQIISGDHQNKADIAASIAGQWYDTEGVDAIVDVPFSSAALAVQEVARRHNRIAMYSGAGSSDLTGKMCCRTGFHWTFDTAAISAGTAGAMTRAGGNSWFFITADYAFGMALERDATAVVKANGGTVLGAVKHPVYSSDFSSYLLQAQSSKAKVIGLANAASDVTNCIRQASEFGLTRSGTQLAGLLVFLSDVHSLGLQTAQGLKLTESFYWDFDDATRAWSARFSPRLQGRRPTMTHAGVYSAVTHWAKAVAAANSRDGLTVAEKMRAIPVNDMMTHDAKILPNNWVQRDFHLFEVKAPAESKGPWDYYKLVTTIPGKEIRPDSAVSACPLVKG